MLSVVLCNDLIRHSKNSVVNLYKLIVVSYCNSMDKIRIKTPFHSIHCIFVMYLPPNKSKIKSSLLIYKTSFLQKYFSLDKSKVRHLMPLGFYTFIKNCWTSNYVLSRSLFFITLMRSVSYLFIEAKS